MFHATLRRFCTWFGVSLIRPSGAFRLKVRIAAGAAQALVRGNGFPRGAPWRFWFVFVSHKLLRWLSPIIGMAALLIALASWRRPFSQLVLAGFLALAAAAVLRLVTKRQHPLLD